MSPYTKLICSVPVVLLASCSGTENPSKTDSVSGNDKQTSAQVLRIAAAANLAGVLPTVIEAYETTEGNTASQARPKVEVTYASSGKLFAQINSGAPYDIFLSANQDFPAKYAQQHVATKSTAQVPFTYARGQLALYSSNQDLSPIKTIDKANLQQLFVTQPHASNMSIKITLANPELAPYGAAAKTFLQQQGLFEDLNDNKYLIQAENIGQAFQYIRSGSTDYGFVAVSQLISDKVSPSQYLILPTSSYPAILQDGIVISDHPLAANFSEYLQSESAQAIFADAGDLAVTP